MSAPRSADDYEAQQIQEWTQYVALVPIDFYGMRAYNAGDPVPASAVDGAAGWVRREWVAGQGEQTAGLSATSPPPTPPVVDDTGLAAPKAASPAPVPSTDGSTVISSEGG